jgi:mono/diheme cytochrome c family protein
MSAGRTCIAIAAALGLAAGAAAAADPKAQLDIGRQEFKAKCAACHGDAGKGNGPQAASLKQKAPDLTTYAKRNGGTLPAKQAWAPIDGRQLDDRAQHNRTMPVWGHTLETQARGDEAKNVEPYVKERIEAILAYLKSIQVK